VFTFREGSETGAREEYPSEVSLQLLVDENIGTAWCEVPADVEALLSRAEDFTIPVRATHARLYRATRAYRVHRLQEKLKAAALAAPKPKDEREKPEGTQRPKPNCKVHVLISAHCCTAVHCCAALERHVW
jgi:hypothetical protein